ncbi:MAG: hypothetical protein U0527_05225 [Candidatus Eisenbacteria bacterium]
MDARTRADLIELLGRWRALLEESLPILARLEAGLSESDLKEVAIPRSAEPDAPPRTASNEELLIALLRSFEQPESVDSTLDAGNATAATTPETGETEPLADFNGDVAAGIAALEPPRAAEPEVIVPAPEFELPGLDDEAPVVLVRREETWGAFPWDALEQVCAVEEGDEPDGQARYHLVYHAGGEEQVLAVSEVGRIVTRGEARAAGIVEEWVLPSRSGELPERHPLATAPMDLLPEASPEQSAFDVSGDDEAPAVPVLAPPPESSAEVKAGGESERAKQLEPELAPRPEPEPALQLDSESPLSWEPRVRLEPVLVFELDAAGENGTTHFAAADSAEPTPAASVDPGAAVVAVRYLPARVALSRALRLAGWTVREEADPTEALGRLREAPPALLCLELAEEAGSGEDVARELLRVGTQVHIVASRHRVVDPASLSDLPRLLHPFTEGELARLPAPASVGPAA